MPISSQFAYPDYMDAPRFASAQTRCLALGIIPCLLISLAVKCHRNDSLHVDLASSISFLNLCLRRRVRFPETVRGLALHWHDLARCPTVALPTELVSQRTRRIHGWRAVVLHASHRSSHPGSVLAGSASRWAFWPSITMASQDCPGQGVKVRSVPDIPQKRGARFPFTAPGKFICVIQCQALRTRTHRRTHGQAFRAPHPPLRIGNTVVIHSTPINPS
ncbi:hypothetical protein FA95DRAFT_1340123 [Auriscalpium vulgare]|uniref:Uncharacterized protein n=1 Tax=Auriscalpium vulgare TaxID=40419 RepID=A0ACB8RRF2_9AGAM|nr:hypothetical protein FA95DRAFT_1340123 [Auriscalpium vulgare]